MVRPSTPSKKELKDLLRAKADQVGLQYNEVGIKPLDPHRGRIFTHLYEKMGIHKEGDTLILSVADMNLLNIDTVQYDIEHLVCQEKIRQEGISDYSFLSVKYASVAAHTQEMLYAYQAYFASDCHIRYFGKQHFKNHHLNGLQEFVDTIHHDLSSTTKWVPAQLIVAALYKEQIKSEWLDKDPGIIRPIIKDITAPFISGFNLINDPNFKWMQRQVLLQMMSIYVWTNVDAANSYATGSLIFDEKMPNVSVSLEERRFMNALTRVKSQEIENLMRDTYVGLTQK